MPPTLPASTRAGIKTPYTSDSHAGDHVNKLYLCQCNFCWSCKGHRLFIVRYVFIKCWNNFTLHCESLYKPELTPLVQ